MRWRRLRYQEPAPPGGCGRNCQPGEQRPARTPPGLVAKCAALFQQRVSVAIVDLVTTAQFNLYADCWRH